MEPLLTIIVPVYKIKEEYLRQSIESMLNQNSEEYRIILVDDGSPDNCGQICDEYASKNKIIQVIHQQNSGVSAARNSGILQTQTPWLTFVDPDDWIEPNAVTTILNEIKGDAKSADIIMFDYSREFENGGCVESLNIKSCFCDEELLNACRDTPFFKLIQNGKVNPFSIKAVWNKVYKKDFIINNKLFFIPEARKGEDLLFNADAVNSARKIYYLNRILYHYRCYNESITNKYNADIVHLTKIEIEELQRQIKKHNLPNSVINSFNCRICTRLYSCMRLYFFHENNPLPKKERIAEAKRLVESEPFASAIKKANSKYLSLQERIFIFCLRKKLYNLCFLFVKLRAKKYLKKLS